MNIKYEDSWNVYENKVIVNSNAKITIGMPVFNDVDFIELSLKSILAQSYKDFHLIISDDGSSDGSRAICEQYAAIDNRITYIRQPKNLGISRNMEFLLSQADTPYFMWAADDDLWENGFVEKLIMLLNQSKEVTTAFCKYSLIDDEGIQLDEGRLFQYCADTPNLRLKKFIENPNDAFGYGIFRTEHIRGVRFPVWWWPNQKCAYNNIYPTLCFYLAKGDIVYDKSDILFFKRVKKEELVNHKLPYKENSLPEVIAYSIRKFNLVYVSFLMIKKASDFKIGFSVLPALINQWFIKPSYYKWKHFVKITLRIKTVSKRETDYLY